MTYLLDTNIYIHFFRGRFNLLDKFTKTGLEDCTISEITLAELVFGAENSANPKKNHKIVEEVSEQVTILPLFDAISIWKGKSKIKEIRKYD